MAGARSKLLSTRLSTHAHRVCISSRSLSTHCHWRSLLLCSLLRCGPVMSTALPTQMAETCGRLAGAAQLPSRRFVGANLQGQAGRGGCRVPCLRRRAARSWCCSGASKGDALVATLLSRVCPGQVRAAEHSYLQRPLRLSASVMQMLLAAASAVASVESLSRP
jgi:hypothetical protein